MSADSFQYQSEKYLKRQKITYDFKDFVKTAEAGNKSKIKMKILNYFDFN